MRIALPDDALVTRLSPLVGSTTVVKWDIGDPPIKDHVDLLVLRYMIPAAELKGLADVSVGIVQSQTLGFDGVKEALPPGITYCNAVDVHEASTAELALALILADARRLPAFLAKQADRTWAHTITPGLAGKRVLLIGYGGVGREIERKLEPFDVELTRIAQNARDDAFGRVYGMSGLLGFLPQADIVILALPLTPETRHIASDRFFDSMKFGALVVNVARGGVVDTDSLQQHTASGWIRAALDVTEPEPLPSDSPLWNTDGVIITPHIGGAHARDGGPGRCCHPRAAGKNCRRTKASQYHLRRRTGLVVPSELTSLGRMPLIRFRALPK